MFKFFSKRKDEPLPTPAVSYTDGQVILYKMEYKGDGSEMQKQRRLIQLRIDIKRQAADIKITKQERRHWQRAKIPILTDTEVNVYCASQTQRSQNLAYAFLRKIPYKKVEENARWRHASYTGPGRIRNENGKHTNPKVCFKHCDRPAPNWDHIAALIFQYGNFDEKLLNPGELRIARKELISQLKKWVGN